MASQKQEPTRRQLSKGKWSAQEDEKLTEAVAAHGAKKWTSIASKAGLNRNGKSCRLRWINYLSPDVKRGGFSDQEEDLIIRLHKLLGNRWALIAARLPGRTDNEVKNYWNSHLRKRINQKEKQSSNGANLTVDGKPSVADDDEKVHVEVKQEYSPSKVGTSAALIKEEVMVKSEDCDVNTNNFGVDDFFNLIDEEPFSLGGSGSTNFFI